MTLPGTPSSVEETIKVDMYDGLQNKSTENLQEGWLTFG